MVPLLWCSQKYNLDRNIEDIALTIDFRYIRSPLRTFAGDEFQILPSGSNTNALTIRLPTPLNITLSLYSPQTYFFDKIVHVDAFCTPVKLCSLIQNHPIKFIQRFQPNHYSTWFVIFFRNESQLTILKNLHLELLSSNTLCTKYTKVSGELNDKLYPPLSLKTVTKLKYFWLK